MKTNRDRISIISRGCKIEGSVHIDGHLIIEGNIDGKISGESIYAEKESNVNAIVQASFVTIAGCFKGEIEATELLTLLGTADVQGNIKCRKLIIDEGCIFNGTIKFRSEVNSAKSHTE